MDISPSLAPFAIPQDQFRALTPDIKAFIASSLIFKQEKSTSGRTASQQQQEYSSAVEPHILLLRRSPDDSWPLRWEIPGGCVDPSDASLIQAAARETREETGLDVKRFIKIVGLGSSKQVPAQLGSETGDNFTAGGEEDDEHTERENKIVTFMGTTRLWGKVSFLVTVESTENVRIQQGEHCEWRWVSEEEVRRLEFSDEDEIKEEEGGRSKRRFQMTSEGVRRTVLEAFRVRREMVASGSI